MTQNNKIYDCSRGCTTERHSTGELSCTYHSGCCKLDAHNWLERVTQEEFSDLFEIRFKNTRKLVYRNASSQILSIGDIVVVESTSGHDVGIVTLQGPIIALQLTRRKADTKTPEFKKIYRKARSLDIERWQEAIAREHKTMIRARQVATNLGLNMKIGDVEFQGDGTKAIFYYIADERVDFRQLIKLFAEEFKVRVEMKQIGARQEAGLIGGIGVCGRALCCSNYISGFQSISTQTARIQDLSLNPQKLAGQCSKLKCCLNYEALNYIDAQGNLPRVNAPLELADGPIFLLKTDILRGIMWFSYDPHNMANMIPLKGSQVIDLFKQIHKGRKPASIMQNSIIDEKKIEFISSVGDEKIDRFDTNRPKLHKKKKRPQRNQK